MQCLDQVLKIYATFYKSLYLRGGGGCVCFTFIKRDNSFYDEQREHPGNGLQDYSSMDMEIRTLHKKTH